MSSPSGTSWRAGTAKTISIRGKKLTGSSGTSKIKIWMCYLSSSQGASTGKIRCRSCTRWHATARVSSFTSSTVSLQPTHLSNSSFKKSMAPKWTSTMIQRMLCSATYCWCVCTWLPSLTELSKQSNFLKLFGKSWSTFPKSRFWSAWMQTSSWVLKTLSVDFHLERTWWRRGRKEQWCRCSTTSLTSWFRRQRTTSWRMTSFVMAKSRR